MMGSKNDRVVVRTGSVLRTEVVANGYTLVTDEPVGMGGTNSGPTPYDYLLAALVVRSTKLSMNSPQRSATASTR